MKNNHLLQHQIEQEPDLPLLPQNCSYLLQALSNEEVNFSQLADEIEKFPSISIKIVSTANSAWASPVAPITSLRDACSLIGLQLVRSIAIALSVSQVFDPSRCPFFDSKAFWISALLTAEAAQLSAKNKPDVCSETARLAGLLHNIGLLWLADKKPLEISDAIYTSQSNNILLTNVLLEKYNLDICTVGGHLITAMELPEITASTIASYTSTDNTDNPLFCNHRYARQLASDVISRSKSVQNEVPDPGISPHFEQLANKLPAIQAMAKILFFE